jgi:transposase
MPNGGKPNLQKKTERRFMQKIKNSELKDFIYGQKIIECMPMQKIKKIR